MQSTKAKVLTPNIKQIRQHFDALKVKQQPGESLEDVLQREIDEDSFPVSPSPNIKIHDVAYMIINREDISVAYTNLTGRFPCKSSRGNEYILVAYYYDGNCIISEDLKNRKAATITKAWQKIHGMFTQVGTVPNTYVMDNDISSEFTTALTKNGTTYQLVPPHTYCRNLAERGIQPFKNHFKAGLISVDPNFPLSEWDHLLEQANITLNCLRSSRSNTKLFTYTYMFGELDFVATPVAPPGTKIVAHIKSGQKLTWELNGEVVWYVGPSTQHYRCVRYYFPRTKNTRL